MKAYHYRYSDEQTFVGELAALRDELKGKEHGPVLFHVFAECWCHDEARAIRAAIRSVLPDAMLVGSASFGNICDGGYTRDDIVITAMAFEDPSTRVETICCPLGPDEAQESLQSFIAEVKRRPWVKGVEAFVMADVEMVTACCDAMAALPEGVEFFGGKSRFDHSPEAPKFVIDDNGEIVSSAAAFVLYGGPELHIQTGMILGWNPLGRTMKVTKAHGDLLCELDGQPAYDLYYKYLHIKNDEHYFFNTLEFPIMFYKDGKSVIRISHACLDDGSMVLGASIPENDYVRIAFGGANEILQSVLEGGREFESFRPDAFVLYSCACRRTFWGDEPSNRETLPFQELAPTSGFYTAGELLRRDGVVTEHNSTLVVAAFREGGADAKPPARFGMSESDISRDESTNTRLSTFVAAAIDELEQANAELARLSITDGLTGLLNRRETERRIRQSLDDPQARGRGVSLVMMDLDDFKNVNDTFGHQEGDHVLQVFASIIGDCADGLRDRVQIGRWGGEEFVVLAEGVEAERAVSLANDICERYSSHEFAVSGAHSVSIGVIRVGESEDADAAISRADAAMYEAKATGKNRVVVR